MLCCYQPRRKLTIFAKMVALPNLIYRKKPYTQQQQIIKSLVQFAVHEMYKSAPMILSILLASDKYRKIFNFDFNRGNFV